MHYMILPLRRYFDFRGRSRRREYWLFVLALIILAVLVMIVEAQLGLGNTRRTQTSIHYDAGPLLGLYWLAMIIPSIAVQVRRFHDQDKSGWWVLLNLIPLFGAFALFIFMLMEGTRGPNRYGPDPTTGGEEDLREIFS